MNLRARHNFDAARGLDLSFVLAALEHRFDGFYVGASRSEAC